MGPLGLMEELIENEEVNFDTAWRDGRFPDQEAELIGEAGQGVEGGRGCGRRGSLGHFDVLGGFAIRLGTWDELVHVVDNHAGSA